MVIPHEKIYKDQSRERFCNTATCVKDFESNRASQIRALARDIDTKVTEILSQQGNCFFQVAKIVSPNAQTDIMHRRFTRCRLQAANHFQITLQHETERYNYSESKLRVSIRGDLQKSWRIWYTEFIINR